jgi:hypothetical protein
MYISARGKGKLANEISADVRAEAGSVRLPPMKEGNYMYVPPLDSLLKAIGISREEFHNSTEVVVPTELLKLLLQVAIANSDFNSVGYLRENPDIADAVQSATLDDPRLHYVGYGFFEGRLGATPEVDERWYLRTYTDVGDAVRSGDVASAAEHFRVIGATEGRSPSATYSLAAEQWKKVFTSSAESGSSKRV